MNLFQKVFGTRSEHEVKRIMPLVEKTESLRPEMQKLTDEQLRDKTREFKKRLGEGETLDPLLQKEQRMNEICDMLGTADEEEMNALMEELGTIQDELTLHDFYTIDAKVEEVARALVFLLLPFLILKKLRTILLQYVYVP